MWYDEGNPEKECSTKMQYVYVLNGEMAGRLKWQLNNGGEI